MSLPKNFKDREFKRYVESPTRPDHSAVEVVIGNPDDISVIQQEGKTSAAGETISAIKAIYSNGVSVFLGNPDGSFQNASIVGITITAATTGSELRYLIDGNLYDSSLSFIDGDPVFLDSSGSLTQTDPSVLGHTYRVLVGYAIGANGLNINIQEPIEII